MTNTPRGLRLGLGPVFAFECIVASRRWQGYALRSLFAAALLVALLVIAARSDVVRPGMTFQQLARIGETFYTAVVGTQLTLVLLVAPAATAGAICRDRASGALAHMLVTDLSDAEIVLGKLAARLVPTLGLVACTLPLLAILTLLGGVDPNALAGAFLVTVGCALLGCALALAFSLWARSTHEALLGTYAVWGLWLLGRPFGKLLTSAFGWLPALPPEVSDPYYLAFAPYWRPGTVTLDNYVTFVAITAALAAGLAGLAVWRLRPVCTRVNIARRQSWQGRLNELGTRLDPMQFFPGPSLDYNPVLWREWHRARPSRWGRMVGAVFIIVATVASVGAIVAPRSSFAMAWVNGFQVSIGMLLLSVTAATSLAEERARGSLDVLMATTLSTREIVAGKWLGTFRLVPPLAVLPVLVVLGAEPQHPLYRVTFLMTLLFVLACGAAVTGLGLALATWCARVSRAVALTVSLYVVVAVGWLFIAMWFRWGPGRDEGLMMASPFFFAGELAADMCSPGYGRSHIEWALFWTAAYVAAALGLFVATLATFNDCLGRVEFGVSRFGGRERSFHFQAAMPPQPRPR